MGRIRHWLKTSKMGVKVVAVNLLSPSQKLVDTILKLVGSIFPIDGQKLVATITAVNLSSPSQKTVATILKLVGSIFSIDGQKLVATITAVNLCMFARKQGPHDS